MKIEKLSENKIKIAFNNKDLEENHISIHSFMSNSIENQTLFLNILDKAEKEVGFVTDNYQIVIESLTQNNNNFTLIIRRFADTIIKNNKSRLRISRKSYRLENNISLYKFENFDIFSDFSKFVSKNFPDISNVLNGNNSLYKLNDSYFLAINKVSFNKRTRFKATCILSEFSEFISISDITLLKFQECGKLIIENFAINICS